MKKLILILIFISFFLKGKGQNYPKLLKLNDSTFVIFTLNQAKQVYKNTLLLSKYEKMDLKVRRVELITTKIEEENKVLRGLSTNKTTLIEEENKILKKRIRRMRFKNKLIMIGSVVVIVLILI